MAINARLVKEALIKLLGGKSGPAMNSPEAPRTLPGNRANTQHPDFDPGDFHRPDDPDAADLLGPAQRVAEERRPERLMRGGEIVEDPTPDQVRNPGAVTRETLDADEARSAQRQLVDEFTKVVGKPPTPEEAADPGLMEYLIDLVRRESDVTARPSLADDIDDIPF
jgi:hypothetical protein